MKQGNIISQTQFANLTGFTRRQFTVLLAGLLAPAGFVRALGQSLASSSKPSGSVLKPGMIVYADSGNAIQGGFIMGVDPVTREQFVIASGELLRMPFDVVFDVSGALIVPILAGFFESTWKLRTKYHCG